MVWFLFRPRFSCALGCGARRGAECTLGASFGSGRGSAARALGVQGRENWQVNTGSLSAELEPTRRMETHRLFFFTHVAGSEVAP